MFWELLDRNLYVMIVFQVSLNFDPAKEILKIRCQIYILMKEVIIMRKRQAAIKTSPPSILNYVSLSLNRNKTFGIENHEKETTEADVRRCSQMFFKTDVLKNFTNFTGKHLCWSKKRFQHRCFFLWNLRNF